MNKSQLIKAMSEQSGLSIKQAESALNAFCATVIDELSNGGTVELVGFGSFSVHERAYRIGRNPKNGKPIEIQAKRVPKFKAGKALKESVT